MAVTKSKLLSFDIYIDVIREECRLWNRFSANYKNTGLMNFLPSENDQAGWENRITLYSCENENVYKSVMDRLCLEMKIQNEVFSPVKSNSENAQTEMALLAIKFLSESDECLEFSLRSLVGKIVIVDCEELVGCSSPLFLGLVVLAPKKNWTIYDYMENLIHEMSHIELFIKQIVDPLIIKGSYLKSPFRNQLRPASGVYHAAFVLARIIKYFENICRQSHHATFLKNRIYKWRLILDETLSQFYDREILTPAGIKIFNEMYTVLK